MVDHLTRWVEAIPLPGSIATNIIRFLLENIIPRFGVIESTDSDNGSHFTANVLKGLMKALEIKWEYHTPWHPSSSGRVEKMNQTLKNQLTKLVLETRLLWTKCLPIALLRVRTAPWLSQAWMEWIKYAVHTLNKSNCYVCTTGRPESQVVPFP
jgi:hypothetical protein